MSSLATDLVGDGLCCTLQVLSPHSPCLSACRPAYCSLPAVHFRLPPQASNVVILTMLGPESMGLPSPTLLTILPRSSSPPSPVLTSHLSLLCFPAQYTSLPEIILFVIRHIFYIPTRKTRFLEIEIFFIAVSSTLNHLGLAY